MSLFFKSSDLGFRSKKFFFAWLIFYSLDPDPKHCMKRDLEFKELNVQFTPYWINNGEDKGFSVCICNKGTTLLFYRFQCESDMLVWKLK